LPTIIYKIKGIVTNEENEWHVNVK